MSCYNGRLPVEALAHRSWSPIQKNSTHTLTEKRAKKNKKNKTKKRDTRWCFGWRRAVVVSGGRRVNEVNARRARLVPGSVTVFGRVCYLGM